MSSISQRKQKQLQKQASGGSASNSASSNHLSFQNNRSFAVNNINDSSLQDSQLLQPGVPSDDDLYDAGWAKHFDPTRNAFYFYPIDGSGATTWINPLLQGSGLQSLTLSQLQQSNPNLGATSSTHNNNNNISKLSTSNLSDSLSSDHSNTSSDDSSLDDNDASFFGESGTSLTLAALMAGNNKSKTNNNNASGHASQFTAEDEVATFANQSIRSKLNTSQAIQEDETFRDEDDDDSLRDFGGDTSHHNHPNNNNTNNNYEQESFVTEEDSILLPSTTGHNFMDGYRGRGGTDRTPLRMPRPKDTDTLPTEGSNTSNTISRAHTKALVAQRRKDYLELFEKDVQKYEHRKLGWVASTLLCILIVTGIGVGVYFLVKSFEDGSWAIISSGEDWVIGEVTRAPIALTNADFPDFTQAALASPISEQAVALNWLLDDPNYPNMTLDEKLSRFALYTIYTATGGPVWGRTDGFSLPESAYEFKSDCEFPYYICPNGEGSDSQYGTVAPVNPGIPAATIPPTTPDSNATTTPTLPSTIDTTANATTLPTNNNVRRRLEERILYDGSFAKGSTLNLTSQGILQGTLPPEMALLSVQYVEASSNPGLIGTLPESIRAWEDFLFSLVLTDNSLTGTLTTVVGQLRHVRTLHLNNNFFTGTLPSSLSLLSQLTSLKLQNNQFSGSIPADLAAYPFVHEVDMSNNKLTGSLPTFYRRLSLASRVREVILSNNNFTGTIPTELGGLTDLEVLRLHSNPNLKAQSSVPNEVCNLMTNHKLRVLSVDCQNILCPCPQCECPTGGTPRVKNLIAVLPDYTVTAITNSPPAGGSAERAPQAEAYTWLQSDPVVDSYSVEVQKQRFALATLYFATSQAPNYTSWNSFSNWVDYDEGSECDWEQTLSVFFRIPDATTDGLPTCFAVNATGGSSGDLVFDAYQSLRLASNNLIGSLPPEIALLSNLKILQLHENSLTGPIPSYLSALTSLNVLDMENTSLTGTLPTQLLGITTLTKLYLGDNSLNGTLPMQLGQLINIETLQLNGNQFTGPIPSELALLSNKLTRLFLTNNRIGGPIPGAMQQLTNMEELYVDGNQLMGTLDDFPLTAAPNLRHLVASDNLLTGFLPSTIGLMPSIRILVLEKNQFRGSIPEIAQVADTLQILHLSRNLITGTIPVEIGLMDQMIEFHAGNNQLQGTIPVEIAAASSLRSLSLDNNRLAGNIPLELSFLPELSKLKLDHNNFRGQIPVELQFLANTLTWLDLSWNALTGAVPTEIGLLTNLEWLYLERSNLSGPIPTELGSLTNLRELSLYGMQLTGTIPTQFGRLADSMQGLFLHESYFEGNIPSELGLLSQMTSIWLHLSALTGTMPQEVCNLLQTGKLQTLAIDCTKVSCSCGCSCPTEEGDAPVSSAGVVADAGAVGGGDAILQSTMPANMADPVRASDSFIP